LEEVRDSIEADVNSAKWLVKASAFSVVSGSQNGISLFRSSSESPVDGVGNIMS
jgi:hypothetical protein